jgi:putative SOS response-associated peptidase YedK
MCGRYCIAASPGEISERYLVQVPKSYTPRYNIAPSEPVLAIISTGFGHDVKTGVFGFSSGLKNRVINARVESIQEKNLFKLHLTTGRCLIPASGYFEWRQDQGKKTPYYIYIPTAPIISFAGLVRTVHEGNEIVIITTEALEPMHMIHNRMPLVLSPAGEEEYLSGKDPLLVEQYDISEYRMHQVSDRINRAGEDGPEIIRPVSIRNAQQTLI